MSGKKRASSMNEKIDLSRSDVPYSVLYGGTHIEMFGNSKMTFEGKYTILEYSSEMLKIKLNKHTLNISGTELTLSNVESGAFLLTGNVSRIEFE